MSEVPILSPLLRREEPYTVNGFCYVSIPRYINGRQKLLSPRLTTKDQGSDGWELRRQIYITVLNADSNTLPPSKAGNPYAELTAGQLAHLSQQRGVCHRLLRYVLGSGFQGLSNWDAAPTQPVSLPSPTTVCCVPELMSEHARAQLCKR